MSILASCGSSSSKRYRSACDRCHSSKVKCPGGGPPCERCGDGSLTCTYSLSARIGKPPGSRNKKTLERLQHTGNAHQEKDGGATDFDRALAVQENNVDVSISSPSQASRTPMTQSMSPIFDGSYCSGSSRSSPPPLPESFDIDDCFNGSSDPPGPWSSDMGILDLDELGKDNVQFPWADTHEESWNVLSSSDNNTLPSRTPDFDLQSSTSFNSALDAAESHGLDCVAARLQKKLDSSAVTEQQGRNSTTSLCQCTRKYSEFVSQLQTIEERQRPVKLDTILTCANIVLATVESRAQCPQCLMDTRVFMQLNIILQTLITWIEIHCQSFNAKSSDISMVLGSHELTREEHSLVATSLMNRSLKRISAVLSKITVRATQISNGGQDRHTQEHDGTDLQVFQQLTYSLLHRCRSLSKSLSSLKLSHKQLEQSAARRGFEGL